MKEGDAKPLAYIPGEVGHGCKAIERDQHLPDVLSQVGQYIKIWEVLRCNNAIGLLKM